ncbi:hypothetical protein PLESTB_001630300 [Pleodorina starrii]|uniref:LysM domain-containing protein n=1 Tax=Pleodorina starrii TaxID=330485 RepID=A0A9W6F8Q2_9CHLO|nr:hypothetical protein PLESTB_001630300 [Pleodorina starrii]
MLLATTSHPPPAHLLAPRRVISPPPPVAKPVPPPIVKPGSPPPPTGGGACPYTIKSGDTLWAIAQVYGTDVVTLQALNPGIVPTNLQVGQIINVPCGGGRPPPPPPRRAIPPPPPRPKSSTPPPPPTAVSGCPSGWSAAVGTIFDSWPKPGTVECVDYSGCTWAGMFSTLDGGSAAPCRNGAQWLNGGNGNFGCRFPESTVRNWNMAATYQLDSSLLGKKLQVMVEGKPTVTVTVNVKDVCSNSDCNGCCNRNTGNKKWKLIDIEKWPASALLGFNPTSSTFDINRDVKIPTAAGLRPGAPESDVMPLCYKILGSSDALI